MTIQACILTVPPSLEREALVRTLREHPRPMLVLDTCQRLEIFSRTDVDITGLPVSDRWKNVMALERLARIAAGLESRILGELEVLGQVRTAYKEFRSRAGADDQTLDRFFQDALGMARRARRESGIDRQMTSLSGLASREILRHVPAGQPIAVIGSGSLAAGVIRTLGKRGNSPVRVSSRCPENAAQLAETVGGFGSGLADLTHLLDGVSGIVSATAAPHPVVYVQHLSIASRPLHIVDLGVPPDCSAEVTGLPGVHYIGLEAIESRAEGNVEERRQRAETAARIIRDGAIQWSHRA